MSFVKVNFSCLALVTALALAPVAARAQQDSLVSAVRQAVSRQAQNLTAGAQEMPAGRYNYSPAPERITFGHLLFNIAQSTNLSCAALAGEKTPSLGNLSDKSPKTRLIAAMKSSFSFCDQALSNVNDLSGTVQLSRGGHPTSLSKSSLLIGLTNDLADHYAQEAAYLRLNGHLPPTATGGGASGAGQGTKAGTGRGGK